MSLRARSALWLFLVPLVCFGSAAAVHAGRGVWTTAGPEGGVIRSLAIEPGISSSGVVYSGTSSGGVFKSSTGGNFWTPIGLDSQLDIVALVIDPRTPTILYAGTFIGRVFKSTDGGASWGTGVTVQLDVPIYALTIDPQTPTTLYVGGVGADGVFKSTDGGATWRSSSVGLPIAIINALAIDPQAPATLYGGSLQGGVFKSTDGGAAWTDSSTGLPNQPIETLAVDPRTPAIVYAGTGDGVFKTSNGGATWTPSNVGLPNQRTILALAIDSQTPAIVYAGTAAGVFKSTNEGATWVAANAGLRDRRISTLAVDTQTPAIVYAGTFGSGVFRSTNGGATWALAPNAHTAQGISVQTIDPRTPAIVYAGTSGGLVFKSTNGGSSWSASHAGLTADVINAIAVDPQTPATIYAGGYAIVDGGGIYLGDLGLVLFKSLDGGASWNPSATGMTGILISGFAIDPQRPATLYAGTDDGLFKSTDAGASWSASALDEFAVVLAIDPQTPDVVYAGTGAGVFKSTNGGVSWSARNTGLPFFPFPPVVVALAIDPETPTVVYAGLNDLGVFKSTDGGATWNASNTGLTHLGIRAVAIVPRTPATVYAGTYGGGMFKSTNGDATWAPENTGFKNLEVASLAIDPAGACLHAGTSTGAFSFATRLDSVCLPPPPLVAALSTTSQSVEVGTPARTFASVRNLSGASSGSVPSDAADGVAGVTCGITQLTGAPTPFTFQAVDSVTNQPVAPLNTPVDIAPATSQTFLVTLTPAAPVCPTDIQFGFNCSNSGLAHIISGTNTLLLSVGSTAGCGLRASVSTSQASFMVGQTLIASGSVTNPGLPGLAADFYVGVVRPDGSIQFVTPTGIVMGHVTDLPSFRPLATNVPLTTPFSVSQSSLFTHQWTADHPHGPYVFFVLSVKTGALAGGAITSDQILRVATAPFAFP